MSPQPRGASSKGPAGLPPLCVCVCGRRRDLGCFVTAVWHCKGCQPSCGHCSSGSREGTGIRQPMSYFIPALMGTARTSGYKAPACSGLAPFSSFRDPGRRGDKEHCCSPPDLCRSCFSSSPQPLCCCQDTEQPRQPRRNPRTGLAASWRGDALPGFGREGVSPLTSCSPASPQAAAGGKLTAPNCVWQGSHLSKGTDAAGFVHAVLQTVCMSLQEISTTTN